MKLSKDLIQKMAGTGSGSSAYYGGNAGVTKSFVEENYISKDFFNKLFTIHGSVTETDPSTQQDVTTPVVVLPNDTDTNITDIQAKFGFWTNGYLSALGQNSSGGGGGGASSLVDLTDIKTNAAGTAVYGLDGSSSDIGKVLMYGNDGKWYAGTVQGGSGTVSSITAGTGLSGGTITSSGTIAINSTFQNYISHGETAYNWGNHANAGYATKTWVENKGYVTSSGVTSVGMTVPTGFSVSGSPITSSGTLALSFGGSVTAKRVLASPNGSAGTPSWRALVASDITSGTFAIGRIPDLSDYYLPLAGGTMSGQIGGSMAGQWSKGRDNAIIKQTGGTSTSWAPVVSMATASGSWEIGTISSTGYAEKLIAAYVTNTQYSASTNSPVIVQFPTTDGTLALLTDTVSAARQLRDGSGNAYNCTLFGQQYMVNGRPQSLGYKDGDNVEHRAWLGYVGAIDMSGSITGASAIEMKPTSASANNGGFIDFHYNQSSADFTSRIIESVSGRLSMEADVYIPSSKYLRIGDGVLEWDSTNNAIKIRNISGNAANLYALGGISALGFTNAISGVQVTSLTTDAVYVGTSSKSVAPYSYTVSSTEYTGLSITSDKRLKLTGSDIYLNSAYVDANSYVHTSRVYLSSSVYIFTDGSDLKMVIGSTTYKLTKTTA